MGGGGDVRGVAGSDRTRSGDTRSGSGVGDGLSDGVSNEVAADRGGDSFVAPGVGVSEDDGGYDFFVSYTRADAEWAVWVAWQLEERVHFGDRPAKVFVQAWDVVPGTNWASAMHRMLQTSARVVPMLSAAYLADSRFGNAEWLAAWPDDPEGLRRRIVPVRVAECRPAGLLRPIT